MHISATPADILRTIGRLIPHYWPTYYTPLADLLHTIGRLITCTSETRSDICGRRCVLAACPWQPARVVAKSWTDMEGAGRLMTWHGRLITWPGSASVSQRQPAPACARGWDLVNLGRDQG